MDSRGTLHQHDDLTLELEGVELVMRRNQRDEQQDAALLEAGLVAVADGMGGHDRGRDASRAALAALAAACRVPCDADELERAAFEADTAVRALPFDGWRAPGTTLVAAAATAAGDRLVGVWCGDSRAYLVHGDGTLERLTSDHCGPLGGLDAALGGHGDVGAHFDHFEVEVGHGHRLLLATDGLTGPFDIAEVRGQLPDGTAVGDADEALAAVLRQGLAQAADAAERFGSDNVTVVTVDVDTFAAAR